MRRADDADGDCLAVRGGSHHVERGVGAGARSDDTGLDPELIRDLAPTFDIDAEPVEGAEDLGMAPEQPDHEEGEEEERHAFDDDQRGHVALRAVLGRTVNAK